jgi:chromosome segregation ATPase
MAENTNTPTIEQLQEENQNLSDTLASKNADLESLGSQLASTGKELGEAKAEIEVLTAVNEELQAKIEELSSPKSIAQAVAEVKDKKASLPATNLFTVEGESFKFVSPVFVFQKKRILAENAINDQKLLEQLVSMKSGAITKA